MRYSKLLFVLMLTLILVFGSSMSSFATRVDDDSDLSYFVWPIGSGTIAGPGWGEYDNGT